MPTSMKESLKSLLLDAMTDRPKRLKKITHFVVKLSDLPKDKENAHSLHILGWQSKLGRKMLGKDPEPEYIVINIDEPYIDEIVAVLQKHGHWDGWNHE